MPCIGPDVEGRREFGRSVGEHMLGALIIAHSLWDVDAEGEGARKIVGSPGIDGWVKAKEEFVRAVGELFAWDSMNSF